MLVQFHQATECRLEPAPVYVERRKIPIESHVKKLAARGQCPVASAMNQGNADTSVSELDIDHDVFDEGVSQAVPQDVDKSDEPAIESSDDPPEAVSIGRVETGLQPA